jgi:hypothetical protein
MKRPSSGFVATKVPIRAAFCLFLLLFLFASRIVAQSSPASPGASDSSLILRNPLLLPRLIGSADFAPVSDTVSVRQTKSAGKAVLLSALLPGLGQIYTKSYWKLPIIWGLGGYYIYGWITNNNRYRDYRDQYLQSLASSTEGDLEIRSLRDFYRNQRDSYAWYFGVLYLANLIDAYVTASLYDFDVSDNLSLQAARDGQLLTLRWRW